MTEERQTITIKSIDTKPQRDLHTNIDGVASKTILKLDPRDRTAWVTQEYNDNGILADEWNGLVCTWNVNGHPTESVMREWIEENTDLLDIICDGFEEHWNGGSRVGRYTDAAHSGIQTIAFGFDNDIGPINYYEFWTVESWLESSRDEISVEMTDEQLAELAKDWEPSGEIVVDGDILECITKIRDALKFESEVDSDDE